MKRFSGFLASNSHTRLLEIAIVGIALLGSVFIVLFPGFYSMSLISLAVAILAFALFLISPFRVMLFLVGIRPMLDPFRNYGVKLAAEATLNINALVALFVTISGIQYVFLQKRNFFKDKTFTLFIVFLLFLSTSYVRSPNRFEFFALFFRWLGAFSIYELFALLVRRKTDFVRLLKTYVYFSVVPLAVALYQAVTWGAIKFTEIIRINGTFVYPKGLSVYTAFLMFVTLGLLWDFTKSFGKKKNLKIYLSVVGLLFFLTYMRGAWVGFVTGFLAIDYFRNRARAARTFRTVLILLVIFAGIFFLVPAFSKRVLQLSSFIWRINLWKGILGHLSKREIIIGRGLGSSVSVVQIVGWGRVTQTHNDYIRILFELGIIGLLLYLMLWGSLLKRAIRLLKVVDDEFMKSMAYVQIGLIVFVLTMSLTDSFFGGGVFHWMFWSFAGALRGLIESKGLDRL